MASTRPPDSCPSGHTLCIAIRDASTVQALHTIDRGESRHEQLKPGACSSWSLLTTYTFGSLLVPTWPLACCRLCGHVAAGRPFTCIMCPTAKEDSKCSKCEGQAQSLDEQAQLSCGRICKNPDGMCTNLKGRGNEHLPFISIKAVCHAAA